MGFSFPFGWWLKENWEPMQERCLLDDRLDRKVVKEIWKDFINGNVHWSRPWALAVIGNS